MLSTFGLGPLRHHWPGVCQVCGRWPSQALCAACRAQCGPARQRCPTCARPLHGTQGRCGACLSERQPPPLEQCLAAVDYGYPWDTLIARFKFRGEHALAHTLASVMVEHQPVGADWRHCTWLVPIPITPERLAQRGYNQAWELAKALRQQLGTGCPPGLPGALMRLGHAPDQHNLPAEQRVKNLKGAFMVPPDQAPRLQGAHVLLVDDVSTTGTTLRTAAQALRAAGVARVSAWVLAKTPPD